MSRLRLRPMCYIRPTCILQVTSHIGLVFVPSKSQPWGKNALKNVITLRRPIESDPPPRLISRPITTLHL